MDRQLNVWSADGLLERCSPSQRHLLSLLAGDPSVLSSLQLQWPARLGVLFWYCYEPTTPVSTVINAFLETMLLQDHNTETEDLGLALVRLYQSMQNQGDWTVKDCLKSGGRK